MSFWEHFDELRSKIVICLWIFFIAFIGFYFVSDQILDWLRAPLFSVLPEGQKHLYYTSLFENFLVHLKVSAYAAFTLLSPVYVYILWGFINPGLKPEERVHVRPFLLAAGVFFLIGSAFAYYVLFPIGVKYFLSYGTSAEVPLLTLESYVGLVMKILFGFGLCFEMPVVIVLLGRLGFLTAAQLQAQRRTAVVVITMIAALVAPPDALSMIMLMVPLYLLYESSVFVVRHLETKRAASTKS